jgi:hypothetical protein
MNHERRRAGSSVRLHSSDYRQSGSDSWVPGFLIVSILSATSPLFAGDAVAIGYNSEGVWTAVTYYSSSTPKGGKDYRTEKEAGEIALADVRKRSEHEVATAKILDSSDSTGYVAVGRGQNKSGTDETVVGREKSQADADKQAMAQLNKAGATRKQKIVYRYFSYGADSK